MTNKHLFSRLHKWGIANDPATEAERFSEACFVERFGRRRQSWLIAIFVLCGNIFLRNLRLKNSCQFVSIFFVPLCLSGISTTVEESLQINLFMQNEPNFRKSQMNVNKVLTKDYEKKTLGERGKKQSQTKPNKPNFKKAKMNVTSILTEGYENKTPIRAPKKQSQISKRQKPMQTSLPQGIMKKTALSGPGKTNPIQSQTKRCTNHTGDMNINNVLFHSDVVFRRHYLTQCKRHPC